MAFFANLSWLLPLLVLTAPFAIIGHVKYAYLHKHEEVTDFGPLKNKWESFLVYFGGWIAFTLCVAIAPLLLWGFTLLFSQQGAYSHY